MDFALAGEIIHNNKLSFYAIFLLEKNVLKFGGKIIISLP